MDWIFVFSRAREACDTGSSRKVDEPTAETRVRETRVLLFLRKGCVESGAEDEAGGETARPPRWHGDVEETTNRTNFGRAEDTG